MSILQTFAKCTGRPMQMLIHTPMMLLEIEVDRLFLLSPSRHQCQCRERCENLMMLHKFYSTSGGPQHAQVIRLLLRLKTESPLQ